MKILFLSLYFPPDLSAGSFRAGPFIEALGARLSPEDQLDVITAQPTRYGSYKVEAPAQEQVNRARVQRIPLPAHQNGLKDQIKSYTTFARHALRLTKDTRYDLVIATSGRLMTAALGARIARRDGARLCLDIRDIFVDTIKDVLPPRVTWAAVPFFKQIERYTVSSAHLVNLVSEGFKPYFEPRYPATRFSYLTNGIDDDFLAPELDFAKPKDPQQPIRLLYAGNLGEGQGLHRILPQLAEALGPRIEVIVFGDGGTRSALEAEISARGLSNITLNAPIGRSELLEQYRAADVLFLHLNDHDAFRKVLPSKLFEYGATGKPILAGIAGYAHQFAQTEIPNIGLFQPCDLPGAVAAFDALALEQTDRTLFKEHFGRRAISDRMAAQFLSVMQHEGTGRDRSDP